LNAQQIKDILDQREMYPLKQLGQNFLHDTTRAKKIVDLLEAPAGSSVVEIGPGLGALTEHIVEMPWTVSSIEMDYKLGQYITEKFQDKSNFTLVAGDALEKLKDFSGTPYIIGALPYNISTILFIEISKLKPLPVGVYIVQKELAERMCAPFRTKAYGAVTVYMQSLFDTKIVQQVHSSCFYPVPGVDSVVIKVTPKKDIQINEDERLKFYEFVKKGFSQRRKKLRNLLPVDLDERAEALTVEQWVELYHSVK
jgi:16S rRNA (adenine1518-N6/adenine1519-N6)-dimethyltransferase